MVLTAGRRVAMVVMVIYGVAKELTNIICPLVGQSPHHLKKTQHFVQHIQKVKLEPCEVMTYMMLRPSAPQFHQHS